MEEINCKFCGVLSDLVKCEDCEAENNSCWFCNKKNKTPTSHILIHVSISSHTRLAVYSSQNRKFSLCCGKCGQTDIFLLGFYYELGSIRFLCELPCGHGVEEWRPLVKDDLIVDLQLDRSIPLASLKNRPTYESGNSIFWLRENTLLASLRNRPTYESTEKYVLVMSNLLNLELSHEKAEHERTCLQTAFMTPRNAASGVYKLDFNKINRSFGVGDKVKITLDSGFESSALIIDIKGRNSAFVQLTSLKADPPNQRSNARVEFTFNSLPYDRAGKGLRKISKGKIDGFIESVILGQNSNAVSYLFPEEEGELSIVDSIAPSFKANQSQIQVIKNTIKNKFTLVQGPPGTGKSTTISMIAYFMANHLFKGEKILIATPSNTAADSIALKIEEIGVKVCRVISYIKENESSSASHLYSSQQCRNLVKEDFKDEYEQKLYENEVNILESYFRRNENYSLSRWEMKSFFEMRDKYEKIALNKADVICCTFSACFDKRMLYSSFKHVILDEASQSTEPDSLIPLVKGAEQVIIFGDHMQLGPTVKSGQASKKGLGESLFSRLFKTGNVPLILKTQYRMHPAISEFPSLEFYKGELNDGVKASERVKRIPGFRWPNPDRPIMFIRSLGDSEYFSCSFINKDEIKIIVGLIKFMLEKGIEGQDIGVISPYSGQIIKIRKEVNSIQANRNQLKKIEIKSVDGFQGREKDFIIFSCVRSSGQAGLGFLTIRNRLNVALTRAKYGLILCGNDRHLSSDLMWKSLIDHYRNYNAIVEDTSWFLS